MSSSTTPLLVSACLLGEAVRYDGNALLDSDVIKLSEQGYELVAFCPEVVGGLSVPRAAAEICRTSASSSQCHVKNCIGEDVTVQFDQGAEAALALAKAQGITIAVLKEGSPSCGSRQIYDGTFSGHRIAGEGITTTLLKAHGIRVLSELRLDEL